jgi:hypothetical protein
MHCTMYSITTDRFYLWTYFKEANNERRSLPAPSYPTSGGGKYSTLVSQVLVRDVKHISVASLDIFDLEFIVVSQNYEDTRIRLPIS